MTVEDVYFRSATVQVRADSEGDAKPIVATLTTENPVRMYDWEHGYVDEVLLVDGMRYKDQMPLLDSHSRWKSSDVIGSVRNIKNEKDRLSGELIFSDATEKSKEARQLVEEGHLSDVSIGYERTGEAHFIPKGESATIQGRTFTASNERGTMVVTSVRIYETSTTPVGADDQAQIRGFQSFQDAQEKLSSRSQKTKPEDERTMSKPNTEAPKPETQTPEGGEGTRSSLDSYYKKEDELRDEAEALAKRTGYTVPDATIRQMARDGGTIVELKSTMMDQYLKDKERKDSIIPPVHATQGDFSGGEQRDLAKFSFMRAIRLNSDRDNEDYGLEREMHQEAIRESRSAKVDFSDGGVMIPSIVLQGSRSFQRDMSVTGSNVGSHTVDTELRAPIDILKANTPLAALGAQFLTDLQGDVSFPKFSEASDPAEKAEIAAADELTPGTSEVTLSPNRLPATVEISTQLKKQNSSGVENKVRDQLFYKISKVVTSRAINGSGSSNQATGILNTAGIGAVAIGTNGGALARSHVVDLETAIDTDDAHLGNLSFLTTPGVKGKARQTAIDSGSGLFLWDRLAPDAPLEGHPAQVSSLVPSNLTKGSGTALNALILGYWPALLIGQWGGINLMIDEKSKFDQGLIRIMVEMFYDVALEYAEAFAAVVDIDLTA